MGTPRLLLGGTSCLLQREHPEAPQIQCTARLCHIPERALRFLACTGVQQVPRGAVACILLPTRAPLVELLVVPLRLGAVVYATFGGTQELLRWGRMTTWDRYVPGATSC